MAFTTLFFVFGFLPLTLVIYRFMPSSFLKDLALYGLSLVFYGWLDPKYVLLMLIVTGWIWLCGLSFQNSHKKFNFVVSVGFLLVILAFYKYVDFWLASLGSLLHMSFPVLVKALPLGISFYIFSAISYLADVWMGKAEVQTDFLDLGLYISFFGKVSMGPIAQYHTLANELSVRHVSTQEAGRGLLLFVKGLAKKVIIADQMAIVFAGLVSDTSFVGAWVMSLAYTFQLYFDFSGYSDMAVGLGYLFGFHLPENFDHPYIADSVQNFWRRWHISLSRWFRDYVYIPLGGSRVGTAKYVRNILVVWLLTGLWHGASWNFVVWGLYYGILLLLEKFVTGQYLEQMPHRLRVVLVFLLANVGWIFFSHTSLLAGCAAIGRTVGIGVTAFASRDSLFYLLSYFVVFVLAAAFSGQLLWHVEQFVSLRLGANAVPVMKVVAVLTFFVCIVYMTASTSQTFLYFEF